MLVLSSVRLGELDNDGDVQPASHLSLKPNFKGCCASPGGFVFAKALGEATVTIYIFFAATGSEKL